MLLGPTMRWWNKTTCCQRPSLFSKSEILRNTYIYAPTSPNHAQSRLKVEVNVNETKSFLPLRHVPFVYPDEAGNSKSIQVTSYDLNEMLGTKLRALLQREQGRDLYDFYHAWERAKSGGASIDPKVVGAAFRFYMAQEQTTYTGAEVKSDLDIRMRSKKFLSDVAYQLPANVSYQPKDGERTFCEIFLPHIDG